MLPDGTRKSYYGKTRAEVAHKLSDGRHNVQKGLPVLNERQTVGEFLSRSWLEMKRHKVKSSTWQRYYDLVMLHIVPEVGKVPIARLTAQQVQALYAKKLEPDPLTGKCLSKTTVHHLHTVLHGALDSALRLGVVQRNVTELADAPRMQRHEMMVFSPAQARTFLDAAQGNRFEALYILALTTGMRQGELLALRWQDVDMDQGTLSVTATLRYRHGEFSFTAPKTARSRRSIRLTPRAVAALRAHRARQLEERVRIGEAWDKASNLVFCTHQGGPIEANNFIKQSFLPLLKKAELPRIRFHDLRHTAATLLLRQGVNPKIVSEMLGHASISITLDVYSHVVPDMQDAAVRAMEVALL